MTGVQTCALPISEERHILTTGSHDLRLTRPGFQPVDTTIDVNEKNTLFRFELKKQEDVNIKISSDPAGAMVYLNGVRVEQTPLNSFYPAGQYTLRIEKEWYLPFEEIVDIQPPSFIRQFKLEEDFASLTVQSVPESGLDIWINNVAQNRQTPYTFARLAPGNYIIRARSSLYEAAEQRISLQRGEDKTITLASSANFATLTINTRPGAIIHINGILQESLQNIRLEPQVVTVKAELAKARSAETRLVLQRGENRVLDLYPELLAGAIQVAVVPEDAEIVLRGDAGEYYRGTDAISISEVPIGNYSLTVSRAGYSSHTESFVLHEGEKVNRSVRLEIAKTPSYEPWRPPVTSHETEIKINRVFDYKTSIFISYLRFPVEIRPNELYAGSFTGSSNREINAGTCLQVGATFREGTDKAGGFDLGWISVNNWGVLHADINYGIIKSAIPGVITLKMLAGGGVGLVVSSNQNWRRPDGDYADAIGRNEGQARATHFLTYRVSAGADFFISRNVSVFARVGYQGFSGAFAGDWLDKDYDTGDDNVDNRFFDVKKEWLEYDVRKIGGLAFEFGLCSWSIR